MLHQNTHFRDFACAVSTLRNTLPPSSLLPALTQFSLPNVTASGEPSLIPPSPQPVEVYNPVLKAAVNQLHLNNNI